MNNFAAGIKMADIVRQNIIEKKVFLIRNLNVMLDKDIRGVYHLEVSI